MFNWMKKLESELGISLNIKQMAIECISLIVLLLGIYFVGAVLG